MSLALKYVCSVQECYFRCLNGPEKLQWRASISWRWISAVSMRTVFITRPLMSDLTSGPKGASYVRQKCTMYVCIHLCLCHMCALHACACSVCYLRGRDHVVPATQGSQSHKSHLSCTSISVCGVCVWLCKCFWIESQHLLLITINVQEWGECGDVLIFLHIHIPEHAHAHTKEVRLKGREQSQDDWCVNGH